MPFETNSREYWDSRFQGSWEESNGPAQSRHFMERLVDALPDAERFYLQQPGRTLLDWGCASGDGTAVLRASFPEASVTGLDFAETAIRTGRERYPEIEFVHGDGIPRTFDTIVVSNCLEHIRDPFREVSQHLGSCGDLYLLLVPFDEYPLVREHVSQFRHESFPPLVGGFIRWFDVLVPTDAAYWDGPEILVCYASARYVQRRLRDGTPPATFGASSPSTDRLLEELTKSIAGLPVELGDPGQIERVVPELISSLVAAVLDNGRLSERLLRLEGELEDARTNPKVQPAFPVIRRFVRSRPALYAIVARTRAVLVRRDASGRDRADHVS